MHHRHADAIDAAQRAARRDWQAQNFSSPAWASTPGQRVTSSCSVPAVQKNTESACTARRVAGAGAAQDQPRRPMSQTVSGGWARTRVVAHATAHARTRVRGLLPAHVSDGRATKNTKKIVAHRVLRIRTVRSNHTHTGRCEKIVSPAEAAPNHGFILPTFLWHR